MFDSTLSKIIAAYVVHKVICEPTERASKKIREKEKTQIEEIDQFLEELEEERKQHNEYLDKMNRKNKLFNLSQAEKAINSKNKSIWQKFIDLFK